MPRTKIVKHPLQRTFLRAWREHCDLSQEELGARVGMSHSEIGRIERGEIPYNQRLLEDAAGVFGCTPAEILVRDPKRSEPIWDLWGKLTPTQRDQALALIDVVRGARPEERPAPPARRRAAEETQPAGIIGR